jgi:hypothetical protein
MDNNSSTSWKLSKIRYQSPLERTLKRSSYIPDTKKIQDIKNILKKYLNLDKSPKNQVDQNRENQGVFQAFPEKLLYTTPKDPKFKESQFKCQPGRILSNTPTLKMKKSKRTRSRNEKSLNIYKINCRNFTSAPGCRRKLTSETRFLNSNYSSYSDIYKGLVQKIPLVY